MHRLTRALLVIAVAVGLSGLAPRGSVAQQQEAYAGGAGTVTAERSNLPARPRPVGAARAHAKIRVRGIEARHRTIEHRARHSRPVTAERKSQRRKTKRRTTQRSNFDDGAERSFDPLTLSFTPNPTLRRSPDRAFLASQSPGGAADGQSSGASDLLNGPPTSTSFDNLGAGHSQRVIVPVFKLLESISPPPPPPD
ncbi:MAG TPA: hypothetical protein VIJ55_05335 [Acetobacteraceae bacterium]